MQRISSLPVFLLAAGLLLPTSWVWAEDEPQIKTRHDRIQVEGLTEATHWLGVDCEPTGETLRAHLKLEKGQGLVVRHVVPDSPAAQAGVQPHDVLLKFNDATLGEVQDLMKAVADAQGQESTLHLIRQGEAQNVKVTPQERPDKIRYRIVDNKLHMAPFREWLPEGVQLPFQPGEEPFRMLLVRPGVVAGRNAFAFVTAELPKGSSLTITREEVGPARITYSQGDEKWETTADKVDDLPEEVRPFVRRALGLDGWNLDVGLHANPHVLRSRIIAPKERDDEGSLKELRKAVDELREEVEKLREERR